MSSHNTKSHYYTFYETEQLRTGFSASSGSVKFIYLFIFLSDYGRNLLCRHITLNLITNINQLYEIGKDLKW